MPILGLVSLKQDRRKNISFWSIGSVYLSGDQGCQA